MLNLQPLLRRDVLKADDVLSEWPINSAEANPLATDCVNHSLVVCRDIIIILDKRNLTVILSLDQLIHLED